MAFAVLALFAGTGARGGAVAQEDWVAQRRLLVGELDLEVIVSTSLRLSKAHTEMYTERLLALASEVFGAGGAALREGKEHPAYCVTIGHNGTLEFGDHPIIREARGMVFRGGEFVGAGKERRWIVPVRRSCSLVLTLYKRSGDDYLGSLRFALKEPLSWDEQLYGGPEVASVIQAKGESEPKCPLRREEALQKALMATEPPSSSIKPLVYRQLLDVRLVRLVDAASGTVLGGHKLAAACTAQVSAQNNTPWFVQRFRGKLFTKRPHGNTLYSIDLDCVGVIPPGKVQTFAAKATEYLGSDKPPSDDLTEVKWSLKGQPQ